MKKLIAGFLLGIIVAFSVSATASQQIVAQLTSFQFVINGVERTVQTPPVVFEGRSYLPVRELANLLGYDVDFIEETRTIQLDTIMSQQTNAPINPNESTQSQPATPVVGGDYYTPIIQAVDKAKNSVVGVVNLQRARLGSQLVEAGTGSGVIYEVSNGKAYIITNHHVIENAVSINISLPNGNRVEARLLGSDELTDLAVLEANASSLAGTTVIEIGDSNTLRQGEPAIAIGNPLGQRFAQTVTVGVISGLNRMLPVTIGGSVIHEIEVLQTDAAINFGNSGGALVNIYGQLVGINSAKIAQTGVEGIGFALPINNSLPIIEDLRQHGHVVRPHLGIIPRDVSTLSVQQIQLLPTRQGVLIADNPSGPAQRSGLRLNDIITAIDGQTVNNTVDLRRILFNKKVGDTVTVTYYRGNNRLQTDVQLEKLPVN